MRPSKKPAIPSPSEVRRASCCTDGVPSNWCPTPARGNAAGTRRSIGGTLNVSSDAPMGEPLPMADARDVSPTSPGQGYPSGAHAESYSMHTHVFQRSCTNHSHNEPRLILHTAVWASASGPPRRPLQSCPYLYAHRNFPIDARLIVCVTSQHP